MGTGRERILETLHVMMTRDDMQRAFSEWKYNCIRRRADSLALWVAHLVSITTQTPTMSLVLLTMCLRNHLLDQKGPKTSGISSHSDPIAEHMC